MAGGGQNQLDPIWTWIILIGMLVGGIFGFWIVGYKYAGPAMLEIKRLEILPMTFISDDAKEKKKHVEQEMVYAKRSIARTQGFGAWEMWARVRTASMIAGKLYRYPVAFILIGMALYIFLTDKTGRFKNNYGLESLLQVQAKTWPIVTPFIKFNPGKLKGRPPGGKVDQKMPLFSEALYPEEWMAFNRIRVMNGVPDRDQIRRALLVQLGPKFEGIDALPDHLYCLLASFALRGTRKRKECDALLGEIATCWSHDGGFVPSASVKAQAAKILTNPKVLEPLSAVLERHAYVATAMLAALQWARSQGGVLPPASFVWLRGEDRTMWYPFNNLGRRAFHVEAAGAMAHYQAELQAGRALSLPRVDSAVVSIVQYLSDTRARIPDLIVGPQAAKALPAPPKSASGIKLASS